MNILYLCLTMKKYTHLTDGEVYQMEVLFREWMSVPKIALRLWRCKTSIYEFLRENDIPYNQKRKNFWPGGKVPWKGKRKVLFSAQTAINKRRKRKSNASKRYCRIVPGSDLEKYIGEKLRDFWSPKQIAGSWIIKTWEKLSKDTIYQHIYTHYEKEEIKQYLRRKWRLYRKRRMEKYWKKYDFENKVMVDKRPEVVNERKRIWDWEADTIVWKGRTGYIATFVERKTGYTIVHKLNSWHGHEMLQSILKRFKHVPSDKRRTMTFDNGKENSQHYKLKRLLNIDTYFCFPYHSWEKGAIENLNWLLRQFIPKQTNFKHITQEQLQHYENLLNSRPRERLNYRTPHEVFWWITESRDSV